MDNSISFTSKIKFVDYKTLEKVSTGAKEIPFIPTRKNIVTASKFSTFNIRTCSGGGVVIPHKRAKGFHILDSGSNNEKIKQLSDDITDFPAERALLIGSKDAEKFGHVYSRLNFQELKKLISKKVKNVSLFEEHSHLYSESSFCYSRKKDTWYIFTEYNENNRDICVNTPKKLLGAFKKINIAKGDQLYIGEKEILPKEYPDIFEIMQNKPLMYLQQMKSNVSAFFKNIKKFFYE